MKITIPKWADYNPRSDRVNYTWFRFENKFFKSTFVLPDSSKLTFLHLLCEASQRNSAEFDLDLEYSAALLRRSIPLIEKDLIILNARGFVTADCRRDDGVMTAQSRVRNVTRRDETERDETKNSRASTSFNFEEIYSIYPRKIGKTSGIKKATREVLTPEAYSQLRSAVDRFAAHHKELGTEGKFIPHFSTFMSSWKDWIDPLTGTADAPKENGINWDKVFDKDVAV